MKEREPWQEEASVDCGGESARRQIAAERGVLRLSNDAVLVLAREAEGPPRRTGRGRLDRDLWVCWRMDRS